MMEKNNTSYKSQRLSVLEQIGIFLIFSLLIYSCNPSEKRENQTKDKLYIVTTTGMIADAIKNITKDKATVEALMGAGVDPHLYKATRKDLEMLREADIIFYNGLHLEGKMGEVLEKLGKQKPVIPVSERLDKKELRKMAANSEAVDPHIWFDVSLWKEVTKYISQKISEKEKQDADFYKENTEKYLVELEKLHQEIQKQIAEIPKERRVLITAHDAFGYFGQAYNIEVRGLQGISTVAEFGLKDIADLVDFIVKRKIKAVFVETSIPRKSLEAVVEGCKQKGHSVKIGGTLFSDAMGTEGTAEGNYIGMVRANVETIVNALK